MSDLEILTGFYVIALIILGWVLHEKKGIPFPATYLWGVAVALIGRVIYEASIGKGHIDLGSVLMAVLVTAFASYVTAKKGF